MFAVVIVPSNKVFGEQNCFEVAGRIMSVPVSYPIEAQKIAFSRAKEQGIDNPRILATRRD